MRNVFLDPNLIVIRFLDRFADGGNVDNMITATESVR